LWSNVAGLQNAWDDGRSVWVMDGFKGTMLRNQESLQPDRNWINSVV